MKVINTVFLLLFIFSVFNCLIAQNQTGDYQQGLVAISYDDTEFKRPFTQWTIEVLNSDSVRWHGSNDWALRCFGYLESPFDGEITIYAETDNYIQVDFNGEQDKLFPVHAVKAAYAKMQKIWDSQAAGDKLVTKFWSVPHEFNREMQDEAFVWLDQQMDHIVRKK